MLHVVGPVSKGAVATLAALRAQGLSIPDFCEKEKLPRLMVQQILRGDARRIALDQAIDLTRAAGTTLGLELAVESWSLRTATPPPPAERLAQPPQRRGAKRRAARSGSVRAGSHA